MNVDLKSLSPKSVSKPLKSEDSDAWKYQHTGCFTHLNLDQFESGQGAPELNLIPEPRLGFEPWLMGGGAEPTNSPALSENYAAKMKDGLGEQALLSIDDERISSIDGYFLEGWEGVGGDSFVNRRAIGSLGDQWKPAEGGGFELKSEGIRQKLSFDMASGTTRLESSYDEHHFETSTFSEIITKDRDGFMTREYPPVGI